MPISRPWGNRYDRTPRKVQCTRGQFLYPELFLEKNKGITSPWTSSPQEIKIKAMKTINYIQHIDVTPFIYSPDTANWPGSVLPAMMPYPSSQPNLGGTWPLTISSITMPNVDSGISPFTNEDGSRRVEFKVPGFNKTNLKVTIPLQQLGNVIRVEGLCGSRRISYSYILGFDADPKTIKAKCEDGLLTVTYSSKSVVDIAIE